MVERLKWWLWRRHSFCYQLDRSFGWSRTMSFLRLFWGGTKYVNPPHIRRQKEEELRREYQKG